jgi:Tol biopolymer transport system component
MAFKVRRRRRKGGSRFPEAAGILWAVSDSDSLRRLSAALEGRYLIERKLGEGGMATVYLAQDLRHERKVALKVLKPELAAVVGAERFLAEIKTMAQLQHPHILPLFDSGEAEGALFYVMPHVEGESLRERLDREHQLPVDEAVGIARNVAEALDYAHARGVIHRDIKPANILLQASKPVVADFGIALAVSAGGGGRLTETGVSLGTPQYMSPEQAVGDSSVGPAADIYALGCVLYEMLVGEPPYTGSTPQAILGKVISGRPTSATEQRSSVPAHVDAVIRKALERVPADRFTGAQALATALSQSGFRHGPGIEAPGAESRSSTWKLAALGFATLATLLAAVAGWAVFRPEPQKPVVRSAVTLPQDLRLETTPGVVFAVSPDGSRIVFAGTSAGETRLWQRPLDALAARPIPGTDDARTPAYSPDGSSVAFISAGRLMVVSLAGSPPVTLIERGLAGGASGLAWSDDGWLYFRRAGESGLRRLPADGGGTQEIVTGDSGQDLDPDAIPGGRGLLFTRYARGGESEIFLLDLKGGGARPLFEGRTARYAAGHIVYTSADGTLLAVPFDARRLEVTGPAKALFGGVETAPIAGSQFALSRTGTLLYRQGTANSGLALAEVDLEGHRRVLPLAPRDYTHRGPTWSPDGESVVFSSDDQVHTYDTRLNATPRQITFEGLNIDAVYSPDGQRIAFSSMREGTQGLDVFVKDLSDDSPPRSVLAMDGDQFVTQWPADTLLLFVSAGERGVTDLWMLDLSDPEQPEARSYLSSEAELSDFAVSPDGRLAAYQSNQSGTEEIYVRGFPDPGEPTIVSHGGGGIPFWSPDGRTLYYGTRIGRWTIAARLVRAAVPKVLSIDSLFGDPGFALAPMPGSTLSPDGNRFIAVVYPDAVHAGADASEPGRLILVQNFFQELERLASGN